MTDEEKLIAKHIEADPHRLGADEVRMVENGVHVWAVIGDYLVADGDIPPVMKDYDLSREAVEAALAYYRRHKAVIDNRLAANVG